jgi:hypothetical protein
MQGKTAVTLVLVLIAYLFVACRTTQTSSPETAPKTLPPDTRPCVANLSMTGSFFSGRTVKSFQEYPNTSKGAAFPYLISKITSIGYKINTSDRESGLISASYQVTAGKGETSTLNAVVTERSPTGVRVDLTFTTGGMVSFSLDEAKKEFCSILEGVPTQQKKPVIVKPPGEVKSAPPQPESKQSPAPQSSLRKATVIVPSENLRQTPNGKIIGKAEEGTTLVILEEQNKWLRVRLDDGNEAWIWKKSTSEGSKTISPPQEQPKPVM